MSRQSVPLDFFERQSPGLGCSDVSIRCNLFIGSVQLGTRLLENLLNWFVSGFWKTCIKDQLKSCGLLQQDCRMKSGLTATEFKIHAGESVQMKGKVLPDTKGFAVNVGKVCENLVLHFNPCFDCPGTWTPLSWTSSTTGCWGKGSRKVTSSIGRKLRSLSMLLSWKWVSQNTHKRSVILFPRCSLIAKNQPATQISAHLWLVQ